MPSELNTEFADLYADYVLTSEEAEAAVETVNNYLFDRYAAGRDGRATPTPPDGLEALDDLPLALDGALSPDVIGRGFDGVIARLHGQQDTGSFYTPEEIVEFQVRRTVRPKMVDRLDAAGIATAGFDDAPSPATLADACTPAEAKRVFANLDTLSCLDPACGSGQYLVGLVDEIATVRKQLADRAGIDAHHATHVWQTCVRNVYGVDLLHEAVAMARLRLKLRALVALPQDAPESDIETIRDSGLLQHQIKQGNSLIGLTELPDIEQTREQATLSGGEWA